MCKYEYIGDDSYRTGCGNTMPRNYTGKNSKMLSIGMCPFCGEDAYIPQLFGVEIEYECPNCREYDDDAEEYTTNVYIDGWEIKDDCSLDEGFEMTKGNMTYEEAVDSIDSAVDAAVKYGVIAELHCGIHIHIDTTGVSPDAINRMQYNLSTQNRHLVAMYGREDGDHHYSFGLIQGYVDEPVPPSHKFQRVSRRVEYNTLELRMFASTTNKDLIKSYLKFAQHISCLMRGECIDDTYSYVGAMNRLRERNEEILNVSSSSM